VCLYTADEFDATLTTTGFRVERCWLSDFGNVKAIARPAAHGAPLAPRGTAIDESAGGSA